MKRYKITFHESRANFGINLLSDAVTSTAPGNSISNRTMICIMKQSALRDDDNPSSASIQRDTLETRHCAPLNGIQLIPRGKS